MLSMHKRQKVSGGPEDAAAARSQDASLANAVFDSRDLVAHIATYLCLNERVYLRPINRITAVVLRDGHGPDSTAIHLSQPVPRCALEQWFESGICKLLTIKQREKVVSLVARTNDVPNLELALAATGLSPTRENLKAAAAANAEDSLRWLLEPGRMRESPDWDALLQTAAKAGHTSVCDLVIQSSPAPVRAAEAAVEALRSGHAALADTLLTHETDPDARSRYHSYSMVALNGCDLATVQQLWARYDGPQHWSWQSEGLDAALGSPTPDWQAKAEWLLSLGAEFAAEEGHDVVLGQNEEGQDEVYFWPGANYYDTVLSATPALSAATVLERFEWLWAQGRRAGGGEGPEGLLSKSIRAGLMEVVDWMYERGVVEHSTEVGTMVANDYDDGMAAEAGRLSVLKALKQVGCALNPRSLAFWAVCGGQIPVLDWVWDAFGWTLEQHGLTAREMNVAAGPEWGSARTAGVETMLWLRAHGCPCNEGAWRSAAGSGCEAALELLEEWGCPKPTDGSPYKTAAGEGACNLVPVLRRLGVPLGAEGKRSIFSYLLVGRAPLQVLRWLVEEEGYVMGEGDCAEAEGAVEWYGSRATDGEKAELLAWVREQRAKLGQ